MPGGGRWRSLLGARQTGRRAVVEWLAVGLVSSLLVVWLVVGGAAGRADNLAYDAFTRLRSGPANDRIVVVAIDDRSVEALGRWPWPRTRHAELIDRLAEARPAGVVYDVLFTEPAPDDRALAAALARAGNVRLPLLVDTPGDDGSPWRVVEPSPDLKAAAAGLGQVALTPDADGVVRRIPLYLRAGDRVWPHLVLPLAGEGPPPPPAAASGAALEALAPEAVAYRGPPGQFRTVSFVDLLRGEVPPAFLTGKLVLVGATADGLGDQYAAPTSGGGQLTPGVELQANLLQTLLEGGGPRTVTAPWRGALSLLPLWLLMTGFFFLRPAANLALGGGLIVLVLAAGAGAFFLTNLWFPPAAAIAGLAFAWPVWSWRRLATASAYMQAEVDAFEREAPLGELIAAPASGDVVSRQVETLRGALRRLRDLDRFISDALRSLPDATLVVGETGRILLSNDRARDLFGEPLLEEGELKAVFDSLLEPNWRPFVEGDGAESDDLLTLSGRVLKAASTRLLNADGGLQGYIVRFADMTAFRAAERQREQVLQLLSHDMRAPQVSILTLLQSGQDRSDPAFERRIGDYAQRTLDLAESYVQLARAESQPYRAVVVDLAQILLDAADALWPQATAKGVTIQTPETEEEFLIEGDPGLILRALTNLLDNALKYGPRDSVVTCGLTAEEDEGRPVCVCTIRDAGPGLSAEALERLFQPFGHGGDQPGAGLGLAFVRTVVERHGGRIGYEAVGAGACFVVTLPRTEMSAED
jgi:CHASE2 domain-containing sensor protein/signal transduction histidine kinase